MSKSLEIAAECWCDEETKNIEMDIVLAEAFAKRLTPKTAIEILSEAFKNDPEYAFGWHSNIAVACYNAIPDGDHDELLGFANDAASRVMRVCFGVETSQDMLGK